MNAKIESLTAYVGTLEGEDRTKGEKKLALLKEKIADYQADQKVIPNIRETKIGKMTLAEIEKLSNWKIGAVGGGKVLTRADIENRIRKIFFMPEDSTLDTIGNKKVYRKTIEVYSDHLLTKEEIESVRINGSFLASSDYFFNAVNYKLTESVISSEKGLLTFNLPLWNKAELNTKEEKSAE